MTATPSRIEALIMTIQNDFLETPQLALTLEVASKRFDVERTACEALLGALVDAHVLTTTNEATFVRYFPRRRVLQHPGSRSHTRGLAPQAA
jgi:hypothetical protein